MSQNSLAWTPSISAATEGPVTATSALPSCAAYRVWVDVRLGGSEQPASLSVGPCSLSVSGSPENPHLVSIQAAPDDVELAYRLVPDVTSWATSDDEREQLRESFGSPPGWRERTFRLALDVSPLEVRAWVDGRYVASFDAVDADSIKLSLPAGASATGSGTVELDASDRYLPLDLRRADAPLRRAGSTGDTPAITMRDTVPFVQNAAADVGATGYRNLQSYMQCSALDSDPTRALYRIPNRTYDRMHLLCDLNDDAEGRNEAAVRLLVPERENPVSSHFSVPTGSGPTYVSVPLDVGAFHDFLTNEDLDAIELDLTRPVSLDQGRYPRPGGPASRVRILAATLEEAPFAMEVSSDRTGHLFETPDIPRFAIAFDSMRDEPQTVSVTLEITDPYGSAAEQQSSLELGPRASEIVEIELPQDLFGRFGLRVTASIEDGSRTTVRATTFALLPPDTRQATTDSPFGVWCFFEGHGGISVEEAAPIFRLVGARWTLANFLTTGTPEETDHKIAVLAEHKVGVSCANVACIHVTCNAGGDVDEMIRRMHEMPPAPYWLVFWETSLSRQHANSFPRELVGESPAPLSAEEESALDNCVATALEYAKRVREEFPDAKLVYGNGYTPFLAALMQRGFPADLIDGFGLDFDMFLSMPELQPGPLHAPFGGIYELKRLQEIHGYPDKPRFLTEAIYCSQASGWLTEREQADHYVRAHLLALAGGVVHFGMTTELWDPCGWYHYGGYGPVGMCHRPPEMNPRESFCAYATMTRMVDRAAFTESLPMPSPSAFALRFSGPAGDIHALWTVRGERWATFRAITNGEPVATDMFGNTYRLRERDGAYHVLLTSSPVYIEGLSGVRDMELGAPASQGDTSGRDTILRFDSRTGWSERPGADDMLDRLVDGPHGSVRAPYTPGRYDIAVDSDAAVNLDGAGLRVELPPDQAAHPLHVFYTRLELAEPVLIAPEARWIGSRIRGNSSWGRVIFELEDAAGTRWRSLMDHSYIDFDGWTEVATRLPTPPDDEDVDPRGYTSWKPDADGAEPRPPLTLVGLLFEGRTHVIRGGSLDPVPDPAFDVSEVFVRA